MAAHEEALRNMVAAAVAGGVQIGLFNPLDCLRIRFQVAATTELSTASASASPSALEFTRQIIRTEGWWWGLHRPGLLINCAAVATSQGLRIGLYPSIRQILSPHPIAIIPNGISNGHANANANGTASGGTDCCTDGVTPPPPSAMVLGGLLSGVIGYWLTAPLFLLKVRAHAATQLRSTRAATSRGAPSTAERTRRAPERVVRPRKLREYWLGSSALVIRGALLTTGQVVGYDGTKWLSRRHEWLRDGPLLHATAAVVGGVGAASCSAPADVVQTRLQIVGGSGAVGCAAQIFQEAGVRGFFRGWGMSVARLCPTFVIGSTVYEQGRRLMGLDYLV